MTYSEQHTALEHITYLPINEQPYACSACGALVFDTRKHDQWHQENGR